MDERNVGDGYLTAAEQGRPIVLLKNSGAGLHHSLMQRLTEAGYAPRPVQTMPEVFQAAEHPSVDALLWPIDDCEIEAMDLLEQLRNRESDLCVIILGPELGAERVSACLRNGAFDFLALPIRPGRLEQSLQQGLEIRGSFRKVRGLSDALKTANEALAGERDSLKRLNASLVLLNQLGHAMSRTHEAEEIVRIVAERLLHILPYDVFSVSWREPEWMWMYGADAMSEEPSRRPEGVESRERSSLTAVRRHATHPHDDRRPMDTIDLPLLSAHQPVGRLRLERGQETPFGSSDRELLMSVATSLALSLTNADAHRNLEQMAMKDGLTDLFNRRAFDQLLSQEVKAADRYRSPLCLLLGDVDHFKTVNDQFGHPVGDALLKEVATLLSESLREVDIVARYGGEEFAIILPRTDVASATVLANRIRERIDRHIFMNEQSTIRLTLSLGVAGFSSTAVRSKDALIEAADHALYRAKTRGRNRVEIYEAVNSDHAETPVGHRP